MNDMLLHMSPQAWLLHMFSSQAAREGGVIRRKIRDIERFYGRDAFLQEVQRRGFSVIENAGQFVIFCNSEPLRQLVWSPSAGDRAGTLQGSGPEF